MFNTNAKEQITDVKRNMQGIDVCYFTIYLKTKSLIWFVYIIGNLKTVLTKAKSKVLINV